MHSSPLTEALVLVTFFVLTGLVVNEVYHGRASPGDFVFLIQYLDYLIWPIRFLSHEYRWLVKQLIDAERLLDLLTTESTVADKEDALGMGSVKGHVSLDMLASRIVPGELRSRTSTFLHHRVKLLPSSAPRGQVRRRS